MYKVIILLILCPSVTLANFNCKRGDGITKTDLGYIYEARCHTQVGVLVKKVGFQEQEIVELKKAITLQDLAIDVHIKRVEKWQETTFKLEDRIIAYKKLDGFENTLWFILGMGITSLAIVGAGKLK